MRANQPPELVRVLGSWAATAIVIGTMIGTGIFIVPADMARTAGAPQAVYLAWILGGLLSLFGALAYAELGAAIPETGGEYAYLTRAFGARWGFLFGWMHSLVGRPASIATIAAGLLRFWSFLDPRVMHPLFAIPASNPAGGFLFTWAQPLAVLAIVVVTAINYLGVRLGGRVQVLLTALKVGVIVAVIGIGFAWGPRSVAPHHAPFSPTLPGFFAALVAALWAYDGWSNVNLVGSEVTAPERTIPRALLGGVSTVLLLYVLITAACFRLLPFEEVARSPHVVSDMMVRVAGPSAARWLTVAMIICALGTLNSSILSGARVDYAMARDGLFFRLARGIHPRYRTPARALLFQGCLASVLALTGTFEDLFSLFIFAQWIFYGLATASLMRLRRLEPDLPRPYRSRGYPLLPSLFVLGAAGVTLSVLLDRPVRSGLGLLVILAGLPFYRRWSASAGRTA